MPLQGQIYFWTEKHLGDGFNGFRLPYIFVRHNKKNKQQKRLSISSDIEIFKICLDFNVENLEKNESNLFLN